MALAETEGVLGGLGVGFPMLGDVVDEAGPVLVEPHQRLIALVADQHHETATHDGMVPVAALRAGPLERRDDQRVLGQPLGDRRQRAGIDLRLQRRRLLGSLPEGLRDECSTGKCGAGNEKCSAAYSIHGDPPNAAR